VLSPKRDAIIAFLLLLTGITFLFFQGTHFIWIAVIVLSIILLLFLFFAYFIVGNMMYDRDPKYKNTIHLKLSEREMHFKTVGIDSEIDWSTYTKLLENDEFILLYYGRTAFTILPKSDFPNKADLEEFVKWMKEKIIYNKSKS